MLPQSVYSLWNHLLLWYNVTKDSEHTSTYQLFILLPCIMVCFPWMAGKGNIYWHIRGQVFFSGQPTTSPSDKKLNNNGCDSALWQQLFFCFSVTLTLRANLKTTNQCICCSELNLTYVIFLWNHQWLTGFYSCIMLVSGIWFSLQKPEVNIRKRWCAEKMRCWKLDT